MGRSPVTLRDVADRSGVSITTVSRVLNDRETGVAIRAETRDRIREAARALGYRPNLLARGLRGSRSGLVGVIAGDVSDPFHAQLLRGVHEVARARGQRLFLGHADQRPAEADGLVVIGECDGLDALADEHRFVVGVADRTARRAVPGVYADGAAGTLLALAHLWALGHRSIACVAHTGTAHGRQRVAGYEAFLRERGAVPRVIGCDPAPAAGFAAGRELFAGDAGTAVFATADTIAIGLLQAAFQAGIAVPGRLSVVGYDGIDLAPFTVPPLTTVDQAGPALGRAAAGLLFDMMDGDLDPDRVEDVVLAPTLVIRGSTAPAGG